MIMMQGTSEGCGGSELATPRCASVDVDYSELKATLASREMCSPPFNCLELKLGALLIVRDYQ